VMFFIVSSSLGGVIVTRQSGISRLRAKGLKKLISTHTHNQDSYL
jgi:hypothetical protein